MKKTVSFKSIVAKAALWLINISLLLAIAACILGCYNAISLFNCMDKPISTEGMITWENRTGVDINGYKISKVLEYNVNNEPEQFSEYIQLTSPYPKITGMEKPNGSPLLKSKDGEGIEAEFKNPSSDLVYKITEPALQRKVISIYLIGLLLYGGIGIAWLWIFRKFIISISRGNFFNRRTIRRVALLGIPPLIFPLFSFVLNRLATNLFVSNFELINGGIKTGFNFEPMTFIFGITFLLIATMVEEGSKIKEESDLTI